MFSFFIFFFFHNCKIKIEKNKNKKHLISVSTYAGNGSWGIVDGSALNAEFKNPTAIYCQTSTSSIFVIDGSNLYLRKIQNGLFC